MEQIDLLTTGYLEDLISENFNAEIFTEAMKLVRKRSSFFPKVPEILAVRNEVIDIIRSRTPAITYEEPTEKTPREMALAKRNCKIINQMVQQEITGEEAQRLVDAPFFFDGEE